MSRFWHVVSLSSYFGLFGLLVLWFSWLEPAAGLPVSFVLIFLVGPLLFPLRGLLYGRLYTHAWVSFLALFYFTVGVFNLAGTMQQPWLAWAAIGLSLLLFLGTVFYVRTHAQTQRKLEKNAESTAVISDENRSLGTPKEKS
jgi:uncharacterized membrane protein